MPDIVTAWLQGCRDLLRHSQLPGYAMLPRRTRLDLNVRALLAFLWSAEALRLIGYLSVWLLASQVLIWEKDLFGPIAAALPMSAALWLWPWLAAARRRHIARLLHYRWPD